MSDDNYEDLVLSSAEVRRDIDVVLAPTYSSLKKAFEIIFSEDNYSKPDFKRLVDGVYYQGGYPQPTSLPKLQVLAETVSAQLKLENLAGRKQFIDQLALRGIKIEFTNVSSPSLPKLDAKQTKGLRDGWEGGGIDAEIPQNKSDALKLLVEKALKIQKEICEAADSIKVEAAEEAEAKYSISKTNFTKAVSLAAVKLRKGEGPMLEKIEAIHDAQENLNDALAPLEKVGGS